MIENSQSWIWEHEGIRDEDRCLIPLADYNAICPKCDARHGPPGHELAIAKCQRCANKKFVKNRNTRVYPKVEFD